jgi:hypothetical protein
MWLNFISSVAFAAEGCTSNGILSLDAAIKSKLAPAILIQIESLNKECAGQELLKVIVRTKDEISSSQRKEIEGTGLTIASVFSNIFTAAGSYKSVIDTAGLDFVIYIEPAKKSDPK